MVMNFVFFEVQTEYFYFINTDFDFKRYNSIKTSVNTSKKVSMTTINSLMLFREIFAGKAQSS
jgi:hypothetical protein